jgi:tripeptide aminopeptidase
MDGQEEKTLINATRLLETFLDLVRIDSPSGEEANISQELAVRLQRLGLDVQTDALHNVVARRPGKGEPLLLMAHMDTVMPGRGVKPVIRDGVVYSDGTTILGADDKSGVAVILEVLQTLRDEAMASPPLEVVVSVQEETGLFGIKRLDAASLESKIGVSFDCGDAPGTIIVTAPSHNILTAIVHGKAAHAGAEPENGINAIVVAAQAVTAMPLGRIDEETTANIGTIHGGLARNIVPDRVELLGEARSRQEAKLEAQTTKMVEALQSAAKRHDTTVDIDIQRAYSGYRLTESDTTVARLSAACRAVGVEPRLVPTGGGSDVNILNALGKQIVNLSTGMASVHTVDEHVALSDMAACAEIVLEFIRQSR